MSDNKTNTHTILFAAVVSGVLGAIAAKVISSKKEYNLKENFEGYGKKLKSFINDIENNISENVQDKAEILSQKAQEVLEIINNKIPGLSELENKDFVKGLLVGAVLGSLLGVGGTAICSSINGKSDEKCNWKKIVSDVLEIVETKCGEKTTCCNHQNHTTNNVLDFAVAGLQLWQNINKRR